MSEPVRITRQELFSPKVNRALERERRLSGRPPRDSGSVSPLRRLAMSSLVYLPLAGLIAAVSAWLILEPSMTDLPLIGGEVMLVNTDPLRGAEVGAISLTVGDKEVLVLPDDTVMEAGADGQPPFDSAREIEPGAVVEVIGEAVDGNTIAAYAIRRATDERAAETGLAIDEDETAMTLFFPLTAVMIALALLAAEGISTRNWARMVERTAVGALLTVVFSFLAMIPAGIAMRIGQFLLNAGAAESGVTTMHNVSGPIFILFAACRSMAWACVGAAAGLGMSLMRTTKVQLRNSVVGGALGGALGGLFFDPIARFLGSDSVFAGAESSRMVGGAAVGLCIGLFVALVDQLAREAWLKVRTGPLAGKAFVLYRSPTIIGSAPDADIYLFKDAEISPHHAAIHRVGQRYEIEDTGSRMGTKVSGTKIRRRRLQSGDQIVLGSTALEFEERAKQDRPPAGRQRGAV